MKISILKERAINESRVAASPDTVKKLKELGFEVYIEKGAGEASNFSDEDYKNAGAKVTNVIFEILADTDILLKVQATLDNNNEEFNEFKLLPEKVVIIGLLSPFENKALIEQYANKKYTSFAMELMPRITRAQSMDVLSSMSNLAGYKAVIEAANELNSVFPMMMTAAGTISPVKMLIIGAGVAGLQAIATGRRLGAIVSAFDIRSAAKEQVESLGGKFIEVPNDDAAQKDQVYATEASDDYKAKQQALIAEAVKKSDIVITTSMIPGKKAPLLISQEMVESMKPGSVIVDLAMITGGNCQLSQKDQMVVHNGVKIIGYTNMASKVAADASPLYARNLLNFVELIYDKENKKIVINQEDEIIKSTLVTYQGQIVN